MLNPGGKKRKIHPQFFLPGIPKSMPKQNFQENIALTKSVRKISLPPNQFFW